MEHLRNLVSCAGVEHLLTPAVLNERFMYDRKGFWGFPDRVSFPVAELWTPENKSELDARGKLCFLQNWFYFAFADEVTNRIVHDSPMPLHMEHLVKKRDERPHYVVESTYLWSAVAGWMAAEEYGTIAVQKERIDKIMTMVVGIVQILKAIVFADDRNEITYLRSGDNSDTGYRIIMSICLLGEVITGAIETIYMEPRNAPQMGAWPMGQKLRDFYLRHNGLCIPEAISVGKNGPGAHSVLAYASLTRQFVPSLKHNDCSETECKALPRPTGPPAHVQKNCHCDLISLSVEDQTTLSSLIKQGVIPMLTVTDRSGGSPRAELHIKGFSPTDRSLPCIAISHVWSDMLGNPLNNSMPSCQLLKLQQTVSQLLSENERWFKLGKKPDAVGFWIDTICVPHDAAVKDLALSQMYDVYKKCSAVLVLDKRIQATDPDNGWHTCVWQIYCSTWGRRLWTLQEGILNDLLFFAFKDDFWTMEYLIETIDKFSHSHNDTFQQYREFLREHKGPRPSEGASASQDKKLMPILMDPVYRLMRYSLLELRGINWEGHESRRVRRLLEQLTWRKTSYPSDESICLAILSGVDVGELLKIPEASRIASVVRKFPTCPSSVLFLAGPRSRHPGCAWVPDTFLSRGPDETLGESSDGIPMPEGLRVELRYITPKPETTVTFLFDGGLRVTNSLKMKLTVDGTEYHITSRDWSTEDIHELFRGGVLLVDRWGRKQCTGCLCRFRKVEDDVTYVTPLSVFDIVSRGTIHDMGERRINLGLVQQGDETKPLLNETFEWEAALSAEAEVHPPKIFCVG